MFPLWILYLFAPEFRFSFVVMSNVVLFASGAVFAFSGLKRRDYLLVNIGVGIFIWQGVSRMFADDWDMAFRAIFFCVCGILVIAANFFINKYGEAVGEN